MARLIKIAFVIAAAAVLTGCDKCGNWQSPQVPTIPSSCTGDR